MTLRRPDHSGRPPLTEDLVADYMRARGEAGTPAGILAGARATALRPSTIRRPKPLRFALTMTVTVAVVLAVLAITTSQTRRSPTGPATGTSTGPARALLLATYHETTDGSEVLLRPADPATASPIEGFEPITIRQPFEAHLSPDGRTLAIMTWLSDAPGTGTLRLIDLEAWTISETPVADLVDFRGVTWTPDSKALVWLSPTERSDTLPVGRAFEVVRWDVGSTEVVRVATLPDPAFRPLDARIWGPSTLVIYGQATGAQDLAAGPPQVLLADLSAGRFAADLTLDGLDVGRRPDPADPALIHQDGAVVAWDLGRDRVFVGTRDRLARVDLVTRSVTTLTTPVGSGSPRAPGELVTGSLSTDGSRLFRTGIATTADDAGVHQAPLGLQVIDTRDGTLVDELLEPVAHLVLAPDGDRLLLGTWTTRGADDPSWASAPTGVMLVDPEGLRVIDSWSTPADTLDLHLATSWDGGHGYAHWSIAGSGGPSRIDVLDLADGLMRTTTSQEPLVALLTLGGR